MSAFTPKHASTFDGEAQPETGQRAVLCLLGLTQAELLEHAHIHMFFQKGQQWRPPRRNARRCRLGSALPYVHSGAPGRDRPILQPRPDLMLHYLAHLDTGCRAEPWAVIAGNSEQHKLL